MIAAKFGDPVIGIDIHLVNAPPPAPPLTPLPLPHPFAGVVFDPIGAAIGAGMSAVFGGGGLVLVNGLPTGNTGTGIKAIPHIPTPPGLGPHPSDPPGNHGTLVTGSKTVHFAGASQSRKMSHVSSCGFPVNLPTSVCMAVPMGAPVEIGGPEAVDWMAAITSGIRTKWMAEKLNKLLKAKPGGWLEKVICFLTGHPVDVMTGELIADAVDFEIPGLIPIRWERNYRSRQTREGALGPGWTHPFDELVEETATGLRLWLGDGRPKEHRALATGESEWDAQDRYTLSHTDVGYEVKTWRGERRVYRKLEGATAYLLVEVRGRAGARIHLEYERGYLVRVDDTAGRELSIAWTRMGRIEGVYFEGQPLVRYQYDAEERLAAAVDPLGHALRYEYRGGVMVKETHKSGLAFYFEWSWYDPEGWCTRTWGEDPKGATQPGEAEGVPRFIYDRRITYDPNRHFTTVTDGRGGVTSYWGNALGLVEREMGPSGFAKQYAWDQDCHKLSETDEEGNKREWRYDERGNCVWERDPLGNETRRRFDEENHVVEIVDAAGSTWESRWDRYGNPVWLGDPTGVATRYAYDERGRVVERADPMGRRVRARWNERHDLVSITDGEGHTTTYEHDSLGRVIASRDANSRVGLAVRDAMGRITSFESPGGERLTLAYDAEGNLVERVDALGRRTRMAYAGLNRLIEIVDPMNHRFRLVYDTEEDLIAIENPIGERYRFELDPAGRVQEEVGFDGKKTRYLRDKVGRAIRRLGPGYATTEMERDALGRVTSRKLKAPPGPHAAPMALRREEHERFGYDVLGDLVTAEAGDVTVLLERDALGRIVKEQRSAGGETRTVESRFDYSGLRTERETSFGHRTRYGWDGAGALVEMRADTGERVLSAELRALRLPVFDLPAWEVKISRDALGLEVARRMPGGVVGIWKRDHLGRPAEREVLTGAFAGQRAQEVARVDYAWRAADEIAAMVDAAAGTTRFEHDPRGHLIAATFPDGSVQHRASDAVGNLFATPGRTDRKYGRGGRLERAGSTEYCYDDHGNLVEKVLRRRNVMEVPVERVGAARGGCAPGRQAGHVWVRCARATRAEGVRGEGHRVCVGWRRSGPRAGERRGDGEAPAARDVGVRAGNVRAGGEVRGQEALLGGDGRARDADDADDRGREAGVEGAARSVRRAARGARGDP
jgi:YD repeat-containing protein